MLLGVHCPHFWSCLVAEKMRENEGKFQYLFNVVLGFGREGKLSSMLSFECFPPYTWLCSGLLFCLVAEKLEENERKWRKCEENFWYLFNVVLGFVGKGKPSPILSFKSFPPYIGWNFTVLGFWKNLTPIRTLFQLNLFWFWIFFHSFSLLPNGNIYVS